MSQQIKQKDGETFTDFLLRKYAVRNNQNKLARHNESFIQNLYEKYSKK